MSHFSQVASFSLWQLSLCTKHMWEHPLLYKKHCTRWRGDPQWMWTSRKKRLNTLLRRRKKSWTTRDEAHTGPTWRHGSRVVGSDVTWRDSKHVTHCPYVTPWHYSLPDKCLGSNVTWYFIYRGHHLTWNRLWWLTGSSHLVNSLIRSEGVLGCLNQPVYTCI